VKNTLEELGVPFASALFFDLVDAPGGPSVDGRVDVPERPFVRGELAVGVHVPLACQEDQLLLRELGVDQRQRHAMESEVPRRVPRILPLVRHGDDVGVVELLPRRVAAARALGRRERLPRVALDPVFHDVVVELL
jgi:hypothetical protein